jgi:DNA primase
MLPQNFRDELRARTAMPALVGRRVKLSRSGRHFKGCCPFHDEKTPSFYVYEDSFHCFGCSAHGDAIEFVMRSEGASFMEAVEKLAGEAGLEVPKSSPAEVEADRKRLSILEILDHAQAEFARALYAPEGAEGLAYLRRRGLSEATIRDFGLGWAGAGRGALTRVLTAAGAAPDLLRQTGLVREDEHGNLVGELFFNRVMFPIRDRAGKIRSFGGRTLGDGQPKYVNGPETSVFSKRRMLFGLDRARAASARGDIVLVVEGYMDVIALHQAGFAGAVAPLGTALTEEQLAELWRLSPVPVLCFDGDKAGAKATARAALAALPHLTPDQSLRVCLLGNGDDPDSFVQTNGAAAFRAVLNGAESLSASLFRLLRETGGDKTPEQRAAFRKRLEAAAASIRDKVLATEYRRDLLDRFFNARRKNAPSPAPHAHRPDPSCDGVAAERARVLTAILLRHPNLIHSVEEAWAHIAMPPYLSALRDAMLRAPLMADDGQSPLDEAGLIAHLNNLGLGQNLQHALGDRPFPLPASARGDVLPDGGKGGGDFQPVLPAEAAQGWWHIWGLMHPGELEAEVEKAYLAYVADPTEPQRLRWQSLARERERHRRLRIHDGVGDDGVSEAIEGFGTHPDDDWG